MKKPDASRLLDLIAALSHRTNLSVGCYCADETAATARCCAHLLPTRGADIVVDSIDFATAPAGDPAGLPRLLTATRASSTRRGGDPALSVRRAAHGTRNRRPTAACAGPFHLHEPAHDMDREQGAPCPHATRHTHRTSGRSHHCLTSRQNAQARFPTPPETAPRRRPSAIGARSPSAAAIRTTMPSALCQYAPSGPARTNSKSRQSVRPCKIFFARFISFASRSLSAFGAPEMKNPAPSCSRLPGFSLGRSRFVLRIFSFGKARLSTPLPAGFAASAHARTRATPGDPSVHRRLHRVRHAVSPPFFTPSRARNARDQRRSPRRRGGSCRKGKETETDLPTVPPSHLAECLPVG